MRVQCENMVFEVPGNYCYLKCVFIQIALFLSLRGCRKEYMMKLVDDNSYERYQMHSNAVFDQSAPRWQTLKQ